MATVQERLQMNRALLDNWNIREQLCLASAVSCSGDQNWMSASRNLKIVCGTHHESINRPADFFSQKSCALQYGHLLENVETPKRKKRANETGQSSPAVETPTDSVLRRLTEERIHELKTEIRKEQEEYAKIYAELQKIQSPQLSEEMLREMWREIEQEQEAQRIAEMKLENQLREREQKRLEMQRSWRLGAPAAISTVPKTTQDANAVIDMDVEEIIGVNKPPQQQQQATATSPLLSSLLKSPTATAPPPTLSVTSSARTNAPTITTLLTSGSIPQTNQPAITLNTNLIPPEKAVQLLSRPISGPPAAETFNVSQAAAQNLLSPSQSAPTLSMLLERNKNKKEEQSELKKENTPMDVESSKQDLPPTSTTDVAGDVAETDPNDEQLLLEVFKNIGDIDELDIDVSAVIDEEVDFLKGVDDSPNTAEESGNFAGKLEVAEKSEKPTPLTEPATANQVEQPAIKEEADVRVDNVITTETSSDDSNDNIPLAAVATLEQKERSSSTPAADDDHDEKPKNEANFLKDKVESATLKDENNVKLEETEEQNITTSASETLPSTQNNEKAECNENEIKDQLQEDVDEIGQKDESFVKDPCSISDAEQKNVSKITEDEEDEVTERFSTPTGDEKLTAQVNLKEAAVKDEDKKPVATAEYDNDVESSFSNAAPTLDEPHDRDSHESNSNHDVNMSATAPLPPPSIVSIADTDEDSCTTDNSIITKRDETRQQNVAHGKTEKTSSSQRTRKASSQEATNKSTNADDSDSSSTTNRASKRSLFSILNSLSSSKSAQSIQRALNDEQLKHNYQKICFRRLDFQTIKRSIENGHIRTTMELQRDLLLMTQNIYFLFANTSSTYKAAEIFKHEMQNIREFIFNANEFESKTEKEIREIKQAAVKQIRAGSRKSLRIA